MKLLQDKIVFLTGGSKGIGLECAKKYVEAGAQVAIISNDPYSLADAVGIVGKCATGILCDVAKPDDIKAAIGQTLDKYGRIDVIHNNAGIAHPARPLHQTEEQEWETLFNVNLKSIYYTTKFGLEALKLSEGCILNTSSLVGEIGQDNHAAYTATKGAINALTKSMALDYAPFKIRVNAVAPAGVWTLMLREWGQAQEDAAGIEKYLNGIHALGYCPDGDVVADACVFLVSAKARFITGNILPVSGGAELGYRRIMQQDGAALYKK
jgi:meso-butanediol dehydrogenase/(S,S)-butanediol dehydrogenase/diacetyl reductase